MCKHFVRKTQPQKYLHTNERINRFIKVPKFQTAFAVHCIFKGEGGVMIQTWTVALAFGGVWESVRQLLQSLLGQRWWTSALFWVGC